MVWWQQIRPEYRDLARDLEDKCDWAWTARHAAIDEEDLTDYKIFLLCKRMANDITVQAGRERLFLSPTAEIDAVWHKHMLRPQCYMPMCDVLLAGLQSKALAHTPDSEDDNAEAKNKRIAAMLEYKKFLTVAPLPSTGALPQARSVVSPQPSTAAASAPVVAPFTNTQADSVLVKVMNSKGDEFIYRVRRNQRLQSVMENYAMKIGVPLSSLHFSTDGERLLGELTPNELELEDNARIDVREMQAGC